MTQQETFRGLLAPLLLAFIAGPTLEGFRQMNRALRPGPRSRPHPGDPVTAATSTRAREAVAAGRRLLEEEGTAALTMRRLAERLGIRAPSLYKHLPDKAALEAAIIATGLEEAAEAFEALSTAVKMPARMPKKIIATSSKPDSAAMKRTNTARNPGNGSTA